MAESSGVYFSGGRTVREERRRFGTCVKSMADTVGTVSFMDGTGSILDTDGMG